MPAADQLREEHHPARHSDVLGLLQELGIIANSSLAVGAALHMSLSAIGMHTGWLLGRVKLNAADEALIGEPAVSWRAGVWPEPPPADAWPTAVLPDGTTSVGVADLGPNSRAAPMRSYIACPIHVGSERVATLEFLTNRPVQIGSDLRQVLTHAATLLGLVIERGRAQVGLRESERRFRAIFDQSYQFIGLMEPDGTLIEANQTAVQFAGLMLDDVVGKKFWDTYWWQISPATQAQLKSAIERAARGELVHYDVEVQGLSLIHI